MGYFYLKKALVGYKNVGVEEEADFMVWTLSEGNELLKEWANYKKKAKEYENQNINLTQIKNSLNSQVEILTKDLTSTKDEIKQLKDYLSKTLNELENEKKKNANFLRISKERANSDRGLTPKKKHNGYLELYREQIDLIKTIKEVKNGGFRQHTVIGKIKFPVWRYNFQTPYLTSLPAEMVKELIIKDLTVMGLEYNSDFELSTSKTQILNTLSTKSFFNFNLNQKQNSKYWEIKFQSGQNL